MPPQNNYMGPYSPNTYGNIDPSQYGANVDYAYPQNPAPQSNNIITTAGPATNSFNQYSGNLNNMLTSLGGGLPGDNLNVGNVNDAYTQMLDRVSRGEDASTKAMIGTIQAQRANRGNEINTQYEGYKRGLQLLGIQQNEAQATGDLLMGHIQQAENEQRAKIQNLDVEVNKALMDAEQAKNKKDLATLEAKMAYVDKLKAEKRDYLKNIAEQMSAGSNIADSVIAGSYAEYAKLSPTDQQKYIQHVAKSFGIPVTSVQAAIEKQRMAGEDRALDIAGKKSTIAGRSSASTGGGYTAQEKRKLRQAGIDPSNVEAADDFLYADKPTEKEFYSLADQYVTDDENLDDEGYLTKEAFNALVQQGVNQGLSKSDLVETYKDYIYLNKWKYAQNYGFTKKEWEKYSEF